MQPLWDIYATFMGCLCSAYANDMQRVFMVEYTMSCCISFVSFIHPPNGKTAKRPANAVREAAKTSSIISQQHAMDATNNQS